ncbi:hypothetical protein BV898_17317 [Hypsibius exemplaris]|uniref:Uncharacterized protein n=1 Tax=Hypsibius exemplaris TaxID=2072580 RepID=A0A9X6NEU7_HYPEX|nr:hypothetical protein BV898_17317 [Hypsibius exemplaris]
MLVLETKPGKAVSIIETDMQVEFEAPVDYEEPKRTSKKALPSEQPVLIDAKQIPGSAAFSKMDLTPFTGSGFALLPKK